MGKRIKSYLAFTSKPYQWILFLLVPGAVIGLEVFLGRALIYVEMGMSALVYAEAVADHFAFGGIAAKNMGLPEYMKASDHGREVLKMALAGNMIRQLVESAAVLGVGLGIFFMRTKADVTGEVCLQCVAVLLLGYMITILVTTIARFFEILHVNLLSAMFGVAAFAAGMPLVVAAPGMMLVLLGLLSAAASVVSIHIVGKRMEESYYDGID